MEDTIAQLETEVATLQKEVSRQARLISRNFEDINALGLRNQQKTEMLRQGWNILHQIFSFLTGKKEADPVPSSRWSRPNVMAILEERLTEAKNNRDHYLSINSSNLYAHYKGKVEELTELKETLSVLPNEEESLVKAAKNWLTQNKMYEGVVARPELLPPTSTEPETKKKLGYGHPPNQG